MNNILEVIQHNLCVGCGTCISVCPNGALRLFEDIKKGTFRPRLNIEICSQCGNCLSICPGLNVHLPVINKPFQEQKYNFYVGSYLECFEGHATDTQLRHSSSSGGLVTALANFALELGDVSAVGVTKMSFENPLRPITHLAKNKMALFSAKGSKYCPVPANLILREISESDGHYLLIGLPCHLQGVRNACDSIKGLEGKISLYFGLVCNHTPTFHATNYLLNYLKLPRDSVIQIDYRSNGWPGGMIVQTRNGNKKYLASSDVNYWGFVFNRFFWTNRCILCEDRFCEKADIVFMDGWLPEHETDTEGTSLIIVKNQIGMDLVKKAIEKKVISLKVIPLEKVLRAQAIDAKTRQLAARKLVSRVFFHRRLPSNKYTIKPTPLTVLDAFDFILSNELCLSGHVISRIIIDYHIALWKIFVYCKKLKKHFLKE
jgi:coenzyme F420 hydrogenase subunit beta